MAGERGPETVYTTELAQGILLAATALQRLREDSASSGEYDRLGEGITGLMAEMHEAQLRDNVHFKIALTLQIPLDIRVQIASGGVLREATERGSGSRLLLSGTIEDVVRGKDRDPEFPNEDPNEFYILLRSGSELTTRRPLSQAVGAEIQRVANPAAV